MKTPLSPRSAKLMQTWLCLLVVAVALGGLDGSVFASTALTRVSGVVNAILVNPANGSVVVAGAFSQIVTDHVNLSASTSTVVSSSSTACQNIVRLLSNGEVDPGFIAKLSTGTDHAVECLALQSDGKVLLGGGFFRVGAAGRSRIARLNTDGSVDSTFIPIVDDEVMSIAVQPDGGIVLGGAFLTLNNAGHRHVGRLLPNGAVDSTFAADADDVVRAVALQSGSNLVLGGDFSILNGVLRYRLGRLTLGGVLDSALNAGVDAPRGSAVSVNCLLVQADGKIVAGGAFATLGALNRKNIGRLGADGTPDATFAPDADAPVQSLALQADQKILVGGQFGTVGAGLRPNLCRLNTDGTVDTAFNPRANGAVLALAVQGDGTILAGGQFTQCAGRIYNAPARVTSAWVSGTNDSLSALRLNVPTPDPLSGPLTPAFTTSGTSYGVAINRHTLGVIPTSVDPAASIVVSCGGTSQTVASGTPSALFPMVTGSNTIAVKVVADDGCTFKTYSLVATRTLSSDATLSNVEVLGGTIRPAFLASRTIYQVTPTVPLAEVSGTSEVSGANLRVHPTTSNPYASVSVQMNGAPSALVGSGTSGPLLVQAGINTLDISVTAEDGVTSTVYTLSTGLVPIPASNDVDLRDLSVSAGTLSPAFSYSGTSYGVIVTGTSASLTPTFDNPNESAVIAISGTQWPISSGRASQTIALGSGTTHILVSVAAESYGTTQLAKTTMIDFIRIGAPVARDPAVGVSGVTLNGSVDPAVVAGGTCVFEYGRTTGYGQSATAVADVVMPTSVSAAVPSLATLPAYGVWHYRLKILLGNGVYFGPDLTFSQSWPGTSAVVVTSDTVPGVAGATFSSFGTPAVNSYGDVAFHSTISGAGATASNNSLVWVESDPNSYLVTRTGTQAPNGAGLVSSLDDPALNSQGAVSFLARTGTTTGLWASTSGSLRLLARTQTDNQVPGLAFGQFSSFSTVALPDAGGLIFQAGLTLHFGGVALSNNKGLWKADSEGQLSTAMRTGEHDFIPTDTGRILRSVLGPLPKTPAGQSMWIETDANGRWTYVFTKHGQPHVARAGWHDAMARSLPGVPDGCWKYIVLNDSRYDAAAGNVGVLFGPLPNAPAGSTLWLASAGNDHWRWVFGKGEAKPFVASPWSVRSGPYGASPAGKAHWAVVDLDGHSAVIDRDARVHSPVSLRAFSAFAPSPEVSGQQRSYNQVGDVALVTSFADGLARIVRVHPSMARTVARTAGSAAPGVRDGVFTTFSQPAINDSAHLAFRAEISGSGITIANRTGIWADLGLAHRLVTRTGDSAPGTHQGIFEQLNDPVYNNADQVAFLAQLEIGKGGVQKGSNAGLWMTGMQGRNRVLHLVARQKTTSVPGYPAGAYFSAFNRFALLESGQLVMQATLAGDVAVADNSGIWATDANRQLRLIVRKGGGLMVDGVAKTIVDLSILTGARETMGQTRGLSDNGQIVYLATFSDGTKGIFQARL